MNMHCGIERTTKGQNICICLNSKFMERENDKTGTFNEKLCIFFKFFSLNYGRQCSLNDQLSSFDQAFPCVLFWLLQACLEACFV